MTTRIRRLTALSAAVFLTALGFLAMQPTAAHAGTVVATGTTTIINDHATGGGNSGVAAYAWANDNFTRTLTVSKEDSNVCASDTHLSGFNPLTEFCYTGTVADSGTFTTLVNAFQPNQSFSIPSGNTIHNVVSGTFNGVESWTFFIPNTILADSSNIVSSLNVNFNADPAGLVPRSQTPRWFLQAFSPSTPSPPVGAIDMHPDWSWTYTTACNEQWTDSGFAGAGNNGFNGQSTPLSIDGNVTGINSCPPPVSDVVSVNAGGNKTTPESTSVSVLVAASSNLGHPVTSFSMSGNPPGLSINNAGLITGAPTALGTFSVTVTATDSIGTTGSDSFTWLVTSGVGPPPVTNTANCTTSFGNEVNPYANGLDVARQHGVPNNPVIVWPATQADPATHFLCIHEGGNVRFEYAPHGSGTDLCVSNPGDDLLVLRWCNSNIWQQFTPSGRFLLSAVNGQFIEPNGKGSQWFTSVANSPWGGDKLNWRDFSSLP